MRIGVDACCWANGRGYGRYTRELLRTMVERAADDEFICFLDPWTAERFDLRAANVRPVRVDQSAAPAEAAAAQGSRTPTDMLRLTRSVWRESPDVFLSPSVYTYFPLPPGQRAVTVVHDAIAERFPELTLPTRRDRMFWRLKVKLALWQSRLVLTVSEFSARELQTVLGVPGERIRVTLEAPAAVYRPSETGEQIGSAAAGVELPPGARWFVYVGGFNPHKNIELLVDAHGAISRELGDAAPHLLLVGSVEGDVFHKDLRAIREAIDRAGTSHLVHWTGFVEDETLRHLHSGALALVLPSACEGFGLPAVEAAACGTPVVATTASPLPGLLQGGGVFVEPGDAAALTEALRTVLADERRRSVMGVRAREAATSLSWSHSADVALQTLREAAR